jgi:uncharacterized protein YhfF
VQALSIWQSNFRTVKLFLLYRVFQSWKLLFGKQKNLNKTLLAGQKCHTCSKLITMTIESAFYLIKGLLMVELSSPGQKMVIVQLQLYFLTKSLYFISPKKELEKWTTINIV